MSMTNAAPDASLQALSHAFTQGSMITLGMKLHAIGGANGMELNLLLPDSEWHKLVAGFSAMPADERHRVGLSIRTAVGRNPFPSSGAPLTPAQQETCDAFVNDCVLLAALAESTGERVLLDTAVESYSLLRGNKIRAKLN